MSSPLNDQETADVREAVASISKTVELLRASGISEPLLISALAHAAGEVIQQHIPQQHRPAVATEAARHLLRISLS